MTEVFDLILQLKYIKKENLNIDKKDIKIIKLFYSDVKDFISYKLWRKIVIDYHIETMSDIIDSCYDLIEPIKNNKQ